MSIGERIKRARENAGLTQVELGEKIGITGVAIMRYEKGKRQPSLEQLHRIADALKIDIYDLIDSGFGALDAVLSPNMQGVNLDHAKVDSKFLSVLLSNLSKLNRNSPVYMRSRNAIYALAESSGLSDMAVNYIAELEGQSEQSAAYFSGTQKLIEAYNQLNTAGQQEAVKRVEELTEIPRYRRQDVPEPSPVESTGQDTPTPPDAPEGPEKPEEDQE